MALSTNILISLSLVLVSSAALTNFHFEYKMEYLVEHFILTNGDLHCSRAGLMEEHGEPRCVLHECRVFPRMKEDNLNKISKQPCCHGFRLLFACRQPHIFTDNLKFSKHITPYICFFTEAFHLMVLYRASAMLS